MFALLLWKLHSTGSVSLTTRDREQFARLEETGDVALFTIGHEGDREEVAILTADRAHALRDYYEQSPAFRGRA